MENVCVHNSKSGCLNFFYLLKCKIGRNDKSCHIILYFFHSLIYSLKTNPCAFLHPLYTKWPIPCILAVLHTKLCSNAKPCIFLHPLYTSWPTASTLEVPHTGLCYKCNPCTVCHPLYPKLSTPSSLGVLCNRLCYKASSSFVRQQNIPLLCLIKKGYFSIMRRWLLFKHYTMCMCVFQRSEDNLQW